MSTAEKKRGLDATSDKPDEDEDGPRKRIAIDTTPDIAPSLSTGPANMGSIAHTISEPHFPYDMICRLWFSLLC